MKRNSAALRATEPAATHAAAPFDELLLHRREKAMREHLGEAQIDKMIMDSFPASDPPSVY